MKEEIKRIGPHDLGGRAAGPVDRSEHELTFWEQRVDAMVHLLLRKKVVKDWAQIRRHIESLGPDVYDRLSYYERWSGAIAALLIEEGVITRDELEQWISDIRSRGQRDATV